MRKRVPHDFPVLFPTSLLAASQESACLNGTERQKCAVHCVTFCGLRHCTSSFQGSIMRLAPVPVAYHCVRCKLWMLWPYSALLGASTLPALIAIDSYYLFLVLFHLISFPFFLPRLLFGSRWPPTLGQKHGPRHRPCQDTMRAHGHTGKCIIDMVA